MLITMLTYFKTHKSKTSCKLLLSKIVATIEYLEIKHHVLRSKPQHCGIYDHGHNFCAITIQVLLPIIKDTSQEVRKKRYAYKERLAPIFCSLFLSHDQQRLQYTIDFLQIVLKLNGIFFQDNPKPSKINQNTVYHPGKKSIFLFIVIYFQ